MCLCLHMIAISWKNLYIRGLQVHYISFHAKLNYVFSSNWITNYFIPHPFFASSTTKRCAIILSETVAESHLACSKCLGVFNTCWGLELLPDLSFPLHTESKKQKERKKERKNHEAFSI